MQIQITKIVNGYLVVAPPLPEEIRFAQANNQQVEPKVTYCTDYNAVCRCLKQTWPDRTDFQVIQER